MLDASYAPPRFKIDRGDTYWKYGVYERRSFLGFKYWHRVHKTDSLRTAQDHIQELKQIPLYYR